MKNKKLLIIGSIVAVIVLFILFGKKANASEPMTASDFSSSDEQSTYESLKALIPSSDHSWVAKIAMGKGGDKAISYGDTLMAVAPNPSGTFTYDYGGTVQKVLWSADTMSKAYEILTSYKTRKAGW